MRDTELYRHLLGIETPWTVASVELSVKEQRVDVLVEHKKDASWQCPECGKALSLYDHSEERRWRHLDSCQFMTYLRARPPRVRCPEHGVKQVRLPWGEPHARFTLMFERLAIDVLKECSITGAAEILRISWDEAWRLMRRAVRRGKAAKVARAPEIIGIDEKAIAKRHRYLTLVYDLQTGTVEHIAQDRKEESLDSYFKTLPAQEVQRIQAIALDMWQPYVNAITANVPDALSKMVYDRFHIMKHAVDAVDTVRKREHRQLLAEGDERLKGTKYWWLYSRHNLPERYQLGFDQLRRAELKTARAWALKETLAALWTYSTEGWGRRHWKRWHAWAVRSRLKPMIEVAHMIRRHLPNVITYFKHPITTATCEGINSVIQTIKQMACGYRNVENFQTAIYFHCGGLQLYPTPLTHGNI